MVRDRDTVGRVLGPTSEGPSYSAQRCQREAVSAEGAEERAWGRWPPGKRPYSHRTWASLANGSRKTTTTISAFHVKNRFAASRRRFIFSQPGNETVPRFHLVVSRDRSFLLRQPKVLPSAISSLSDDASPVPRLTCLVAVCQVNVVTFQVTLFFQMLFLWSEPHTRLPSQSVFRSGQPSPAPGRDPERLPVPFKARRTEVLGQAGPTPAHPAVI